MGRFRNTLARLGLAEARHSSEFQTRLPLDQFDGGFGWQETGVGVNERTAMKLSAVWACTSLLANSVAQLPIDTFRMVDGVRMPVDPSPRLVHRRDPGGVREPWKVNVGSFDWRHQAMLSATLRGNVWGLYLERDSFEFPTAIQLIHPDDVLVEREPDRFGRPKVRFGGELVPWDDVFHMAWNRSPGQFEGVSPVRANALGIGLGLAAERFGAQFFGQGANPSSVLETDQDLSDDDVRSVQARWVRSQGGKRRPAVLTGGLSWRPITIMPEESQFLATRQFQVSEIARWYGVPPWLIGDTGSKVSNWGSGIEQQFIGWVQVGLMPWLIRFEEAFSDLLPRGQFVKFNVNALLRGDSKSRAAFYMAMRQIGAMNANEVRALEEMRPIPDAEGGNDYSKPLNWGPLGNELDGFTDEVSDDDD